MMNHNICNHIHIIVQHHHAGELNHNGMKTSHSSTSRDVCFHVSTWMFVYNSRQGALVHTGNFKYSRCFDTNSVIDECALSEPRAWLLFHGINYRYILTHSCLVSYSLRDHRFFHHWITNLGIFCSHYNDIWGKKVQPWVKVRGFITLLGWMMWFICVPEHSPSQNESV